MGRVGMAGGSGIHGQCRMQVTCVAFGCPFVADLGHGQCSVVLPAGMKWAALENKIRFVLCPLVIEIGRHSD